MDKRQRGGVLCALTAFGLWGVMPLYFFAIKQVSEFEILAQRIVGSVILLAGVLTIYGRWGAVVHCLSDRRTRLLFVVSAFFLSANWLIYIYGVASGQTVETSLGYFINPLLNVALGMVIFRERLRPAQALALVFGTGAVLVLIAATGTLPWIALSLAVTFALYGLFRKIAPADAVVGLSIETLLLSLPAAGYLAFIVGTGRSQFLHVDRTTDVLLLISGLITTAPLICFGHAARTIPLSTLGFLQFLSPSMQFVLAVTALGEPLSRIKLVSFIIIWIGLAIYSIDAWLVGRALRTKTAAFVNEQVVESAAAEA